MLSNKLKCFKDSVEETRKCHQAEIEGDLRAKSLCEAQQSNKQLRLFLLQGCWTSAACLGNAFGDEVSEYYEIQILHP